MDIDTNAMKPSQLVKAINVMVDIKQPVFLWGPPGVGKSQVIKQVADKRGIQFKDVRLSQLDPVDLRGLPHLNDGRTSWAIPDFLPSEGKGILMLDELNSAPPLVQAAAFQLILDRKLGDYTMPDGWVIIAAGNRETDRGVTHKMATPLANRFTHLEFAVDLDDWCSWALANGIVTELIAFMRFRPELLHQFDPKAKSKAFPTPRSWEFVSNIIDGNTDDEIEFPLIAGTVGSGPAAEVVGFLRIFRNLPSVESILLDPTGTPVPEDPATLYALSGALARRANAMNFEQIKQFIDRMPAEFSVLSVADARKRDPAIAHTRAFIAWCAENASVML